MSDYIVPVVGSVWAASDGSFVERILEVTKRGRGYSVVTESGRYRLRDFLRRDLVQIADEGSVPLA